MWILQMSDIHLPEEAEAAVRPSYLLDRLRHHILSQVGAGADLRVALCGDITSRGEPRGYQLARWFLHRLLDSFNPWPRLWMVPGNHDLVDGDLDFAHYNQLAWHLQQSDNFLFSRQTRVRLIVEEELDLLLVNSAYHGDHTYGDVDLDALTAALDARTSSPLVVLTHHHFIPGDRSDRSTTVNAYPFLQSLLSAGASLILHGHMHEATGLLMGSDRCLLLGVGSFLRPPGENFNCQFNLVNFTESPPTVQRFRYVGDLHGPGQLGDFATSEVEVI